MNVIMTSPLLRPSESVLWLITMRVEKISRLLPWCLRDCAYQMVSPFGNLPSVHVRGASIVHTDDVHIFLRVLDTPLSVCKLFLPFIRNIFTPCLPFCPDVICGSSLRPSSVFLRPCWPAGRHALTDCSFAHPRDHILQIRVGTNEEGVRPSVPFSNFGSKIEFGIWRHASESAMPLTAALTPHALLHKDKRERERQWEKEEEEETVGFLIVIIWRPCLPALLPSSF